MGALSNVYLRFRDEALASYLEQMLHSSMIRPEKYATQSYPFWNETKTLRLPCTSHSTFHHKYHLLFPSLPLIDLLSPPIARMTILFAASTIPINPPGAAPLTVSQVWAGLEMKRKYVSCLFIFPICCFIETNGWPGTLGYSLQSSIRARYWKTTVKVFSAKSNSKTVWYAARCDHSM